MNTTKRNWSAMTGFEGIDGQKNAFWTREEWLAKAIEWSDLNDEDYTEEEKQEHIDWLTAMDDEDLMFHIQENWAIEIRETTWLKEGNKCYWKDPADETSGVFTIAEIYHDECDALDEDTMLLLVGEYGGENQVFLRECYGLTEEVCPRCGSPLYVSDLCSYPYVCIECDENF